MRSHEYDMTDVIADIPFSQFTRSGGPYGTLVRYGETGEFAIDWIGIREISVGADQIMLHDYVGRRQEKKKDDSFPVCFCEMTTHDDSWGGRELRLLGKFGVLKLPEGVDHETPFPADGHLKGPTYWRESYYYVARCPNTNYVLLEVRGADHSMARRPRGEGYAIGTQACLDRLRTLVHSKKYYYRDTPLEYWYDRFCMEEYGRRDLQGVPDLALPSSVPCVCLLVSGHHALFSPPLSVMEADTDLLVMCPLQEVPEEWGEIMYVSPRFPLENYVTKLRHVRGEIRWDDRLRLRSASGKWTHKLVLLDAQGNVTLRDQEKS